MTTYLPGRRLRSAHAAAALSLLGYVVAIVLGLALLPSPWGALAVVSIAALAIAERAYRAATIGRFQRANRDVLVAMQTDPELVADRLAELGDQFRWPIHLSRLAGYNRSLALLQAGRLDRAGDVLAFVDRSGGVIGLDAAIAGTLAYVHALRGDLPAATAWLAEAKRRNTTAPERFPHVLAEIAVDLRAGKVREVAAWLDDHWARLEHAMTGERLRPLRALRAFAVAEAGDAREAGLAALRAVRYQELAYLGAAWPELDRFLRGNLAS